MRIGMILDYTFPPDPRVENEAQALIDSSHDVFLFCLKYGNEPKEENIQGIEVRRYKSNKLEYKLSALAYTVPLYTNLMADKITHFLDNNKIEALHIHDIKIAGAVFKSNKKKSLPTVLDLHDNMPEVMKLYPHLNKFPGKYIIKPSVWKKREAEFIEKSDKVITVSPEFIEEIKGRGTIEKDKLVLVPNTVRESFYKEAEIDSNILNRYKDNLVILYLGDTHLRGGLQTAILAIKELSKSIPTIKLVIVGTNSTDVILKKQVVDLSIQEFVDFEGWQNVKLFPSYIESSSICISPLHRNIQHDVAYANKIFQYMSLGKPLLVSDAIAQKKLINKIGSGLVHKAEDSKDFENKVLELYNNPDVCSKMGHLGKCFIENEFCWEKASQNLINLYNNLDS